MICTKAYSIEILSSINVLSYWAFEEFSIATMADSVTADLLQTPLLNAYFIIPGKIGNMLDDTSPGACRVELENGNLRYPDTGISFALWFQWADGATIDLQLDYISKMPAGLTLNFELIYRTSGAAPHTIDTSGDGVGGNTTQITGLVSAFGWNLLVLTFDPADGIARFSLNNGALTDMDTFAFDPTLAGDTGDLVVRGTSSYFDEVAVFDKPLNATQIAYLWNSGNGHTYPLTMP
jgi:hypothetical protein